MPSSLAASTSPSEATKPQRVSSSSPDRARPSRTSSVRSLSTQRLSCSVKVDGRISVCAIRLPFFAADHAPQGIDVLGAGAKEPELEDSGSVVHRRTANVVHAELEHEHIEGSPELACNLGAGKIHRGAGSGEGPQFHDFCFPS